MASTLSISFTESVVHNSMSLLVLGLAGIILSSIGWVIYSIFLHPLRSYPGPLLWRLSKIPYDYHSFHGTLPSTLKNLHQTYGPVVRIGPTRLSYTDGRVWKEVWAARNPEWPKDTRGIKLPPNGSYSILNAPTDIHARYRRLLAHAFSEKGLKDQQPRIQEYVELLVDRLEEKAQSGEATDIVDWYTNTVFDVIGDLAFGESFNGLLHRKVHEWIPAILDSVKYTFQASIVSRHHLKWAEKYLVDTSVVQGRMKNYRLAAHKVHKRAALGGERGDFWDRVLIKSKDDNKAGDGMTQDEMVNNAAVLILGGAETSATTLSGTTYLLLTHPAIYRKLTQEIRSTFSSSDEIDVYSVTKLPYMLATLDEAMRIYPPVPDSASRIPPVGGGTVLGKYLPEGTTIHIPQLATNHSESNFARADEFCPERWLHDSERPEEFKRGDKAAFQPFTVGNRNCIGRNLAYAEMRLVLAKVLYNFDLEMDGRSRGKDWFEQKAYGVWLKGPLYVRVKPVVRE
ncbi:Averantin hydroxylase [Fulvia fulva]|uniref:Averantin hydroxylase n=1 Tax=Passalora fulva TaxID=5499 RepID=A0A9Q8L5X0_PASFU|nr:Averantin hydroxylase [Fulvia fulva]KAK4634224.1 Averantin hydroxylase [Fulvia fulva]KAK4637020.1 Averantin hydroxylase [Fulvia fulva]UJO11455.1 Averantin hydroxylase [Fulvia fulva]WPV10179.1 Averantin hydroxylase [Fulvia fulva]WPV23551.1 Averantin hydroxylase [Fulvia fulva]